MAVKVVSEKPIKTYRTMCSKCFYELEYTPIDVHKSWYESWGERIDWQYIICPREECKHKTEVKGAYGV